jgi:hypothetical protein
LRDELGERRQRGGSRMRQSCEAGGLSGSVPSRFILPLSIVTQLPVDDPDDLAGDDRWSDPDARGAPPWSRGRFERRRSRPRVHPARPERRNLHARRFFGSTASRCPRVVSKSLYPGLYGAVQIGGRNGSGTRGVQRKIRGRQCRSAGSERQVCPKAWRSVSDCERSRRHRSPRLRRPTSIRVCRSMDVLHRHRWAHPCRRSSRDTGNLRPDRRGPAGRTGYSTP